MRAICILSFGEAEGAWCVCAASRDFARPEPTAAAPRNSRRVDIPYFVSDDEAGFFSEVLELAAVLLESELDVLDSEDSPDFADPFPEEEPEPLA